MQFDFSQGKCCASLLRKDHAFVHGNKVRILLSLLDRELAGVNPSWLLCEHSHALQQDCDSAAPTRLSIKDPNAQPHSYTSPKGKTA
jgi:hypothetical protein